MAEPQNVTLSRIIDVIARLVSFDTESTKSNLDLISWVEDYVRPFGARVSRTPNEARDKTTLCVTIGPVRDGGVVLSGHTDVVPVEGQAWASDPYRLRQAEGKLFGRGTCDMKAFCAIALGHVPVFHKAGLKVPIHILLSYDEEVTSRGSIAAIEEFGKSMPLAAAAIVGEPTMMRVADAHKSISTYLTTVHGFEAHSSKPMLGANAISGACELVNELNRFGMKLESEIDESGRFEPGYSTINIGTIHGGTARNILARECKFLWEFRGLPGIRQDLALRHMEGHAQATVLPKLRRYTENAHIGTEIGTEVPGLLPEPGSSAEKLTLKLSQTKETVAMPFATEAGQFQIRGIPTVLCGPGNVDQAHQPNEFIAIDQIVSCMGFMQRLSSELAS
jgi:acetylornithine deacetylase